MSPQTIRQWALSALSTDRVAERADHWAALLGGQFRVVDQFDTEGRRYLIAERQPSGGPLSAADREMLAARARGTQLKVIAFDLGVSESTVSRRLQRAMARLGLRGQSDLARLLAPALER